MAAQRDTIPIGPLGPWLPERTVLITITPEQARTVLDEYNGTNRGFKRDIWNRIRDDLKSDNWKINGQTIIFGFDRATGLPRLLDGQNRLMACTEAGIPLTTYVVFGLDPSVFTTIDRGAKRSLADDLAVRKEKNASLLAATCRLVIAYSGGTRTTHCFAYFSRSEDVFEFIEQNPIIRDSIGFASHQNLPVAGRIIAATHYLFGLKNARMRDDFFAKLVSGADMEQGDPVLAARNRLFEERLRIPGSLKAVGAVIPFSMMHVLISAWNSVRKNKPMKFTRFGTSQADDGQRISVLPEII